VFAYSPQTNIRCFFFPVGNGKEVTMFASVDVFINTASVFRVKASAQNANKREYIEV
jgi:hypothetical protein